MNSTFLQESKSTEAEMASSMWGWCRLHSTISIPGSLARSAERQGRQQSLADAEVLSIHLLINSNEGSRMPVPAGCMAGAEVSCIPKIHSDIQKSGVPGQRVQRCG